MKTLTKVAAPHIRWMVRCDMPEVLAIEQASFQFPWSEEDFVRTLRSRNCISMVAEVGETIVGYMIYELHPDRIHLLNLATNYHSRGYGRAMIEKLRSKLSLGKRRKIVCEVRESNLDACYFFKAMGFRATRILRDIYEDTTEDAYQFEYHVRREAF